MEAGNTKTIALDTSYDEVSNLISFGGDNSIQRLFTILEELEEWIAAQSNSDQVQEKVKSLKNDRIAQCLFDANVPEPAGRRCPRSTSNGNCLYNTCSILLRGDEELSYALRLAVSIELFCRAELYSSNHVYLDKKLNGKQSSDVEKLFKIAFPHKVTDKVQCKNFDKIELIKAESKANLQNHRFSCLMDILALSSVIKKSIELIYPLEEMNAYKHMNSGKIDPIDRQEGDCITIMWSSIPTIQAPAGKSKFYPNHFVPVVAIDFIEKTVNIKKTNLSKAPISIKRKNVFHNPQLHPKKIAKKDATLKTKQKSIMEMLPSLPKSSTNHPSTRPLSPDDQKHNPKSDSSSDDTHDSDHISDIDLNPVPNVDTNVCVLKSAQVYQHDIANYLTKFGTMTSSEKVDLNRKVWRPPNDFKFPTGAKKSGCCKLSWLKKYNWLVYSPSLNALFCLHCLLVGENGKEGLITTGLNFWHSATSKLKSHDAKKPHDRFQFMTLAVLNPAKSIDNMGQKMMTDLVRKNRKMIRPMIACIEFLGKNNIALRGHRDDSKYYLSDDRGSHCGNFQNVLELVLQFAPKELSSLIRSSPKNANYRSKTIQNQIIEIFGDYIIQDIVVEIKENDYYSVLADEATDVSNQTQMSLVLRFIDKHQVIKENLVGFIHCQNGTSGEAIAQSIISNVEKLGLDFQNCRGQGYDGAGAMAGCEKGVATRIARDYPLAPYVHCFSHKLNLCVVKVTKVQEIQNMFDVCRCISDWFGASPRRYRFFKHVIEQSDLPEKDRKKLINICRTRWLERIEGLTRMVQSFVPTHTAIRKVAKSRPSDRDEFWENSPWDTNARVMAVGFLNKLESFAFIVALVVVKEIFSYVQSITAGLQESTLSIVKAYKSVSNVIETLGGVKMNIAFYHNKWFNSAVQLATKVGINPKMPRVCSRSVYRANAMVPSRKSSPTIAKMITTAKKSKSAATKKSTSTAAKNSNDVLQSGETAIQSHSAEESTTRKSKDVSQSGETASRSTSAEESVAKNSNDVSQSETASQSTSAEESAEKNSNDVSQSETASQSISAVEPAPISSTSGSAINNEETYFRRNLTVVCMDEVLNELRTRFDPETIKVIDGFHCIPAIMARSLDWKERLRKFLIRYREDMPSPETINAEIDLWGNFWLKGSKSKSHVLPETVTDTISAMYQNMYPNIYKALRILAVLPVTTCTCERSISTLRRVKTYLRNSMTQDRFNGLILLNIHNDKKFNIDRIIDMLAIKYPKRLKMVHMFDDD